MGGSLCAAELGAGLAAAELGAGLAATAAGEAGTAGGIADLRAWVTAFPPVPGWEG